MVKLERGGQPLWVLPGRALYLPGASTLLVADAHIGKGLSFRRQGVPVPRGTTRDTLDRLDALVRGMTARRVVFLGDLLHSPHAQGSAALAALERWRGQHASLELVLVRGNHDDRAGDPPASLGIACVDEPWRLDGLALCHHPQTVPGAYALAGHLHPCATLGGRAFDRLRLPCFWFGDTVGVLPAFGAFTGMHRIEPAPGDRVFVVAEDRVHELPGPAR